MNRKEQTIFLHGVLLGKQGNTYTPFKTSLSELSRLTDLSELEVIAALDKLQKQSLLNCIFFDDEICLNMSIYLSTIEVG